MSVKINKCDTRKVNLYRADPDSVQGYTRYTLRYILVETQRQRLIFSRCQMKRERNVKLKKKLNVALKFSNVPNETYCKHERVMCNVETAGNDQTQ